MTRILLAGQAWALFVLGNQADGRTAIEQVLEQAPDNTLAQFYKARMLLASGEDDAQARQLLEQVAASGAGLARRPGVYSMHCSGQPGHVSKRGLYSD